MKTVYNINKWIFIITCVLYLTFYLGLLAQIVLGITQLLLALFLLIYWKSFTPNHKTHLLLYWTIILIYGLICLTEVYTFFKPIGSVLFFTLLPMLIAGYFVYVTQQIQGDFEIKTVH